MATGEDILSIATPHVGEEYFLGVQVPKDNPNWEGPWNCSEFISWCVYQASQTLYGCDDDNGAPSTAHAYTGYWGRDARALGEKIELSIAAHTPGAAVLRLPPQPGIPGHIVISDGKGGTVEAHSHKDGVIKGTLAGRRWDMGILVPSIQYIRGTGIQVSPPLIVYYVTSPLMRGNKVLEIQQQVKARAFDPGPLDDVYGPKTAAAVNAFQIVSGLVPDGEVGPETAAALGITLL